jgi:hypothetical protein
MHVFVQNNLVTRTTGQVAVAARALGLDVLDASYPLQEEPAPPSEPTFVMGSVGFIRTLRKLPAWAPLIYWDDAAFDASEWAKRYPLAYIGANGKSVPAREVSYHLPAAVRPLLGDKLFNGGVYSADTWKSVDSDRHAWVASIKEIQREVRVWIVGGEAVAAAQYKPSIEIETDLDNIRHVIEMLFPLPLENIVADLAWTNDGWKLLEFNCINTAGIYAIDAGAILRAFLRLPHGQSEDTK